MIPAEWQAAEQRGRDHELEALLNPGDRYSLVVEFPADTPQDVVDTHLATMLQYADDITTSINGRAIGAYREDWT